MNQLTKLLKLLEQDSNIKTLTYSYPVDTGLNEIDRFHNKLKQIGYTYITNIRDGIIVDTIRKDSKDNTELFDRLSEND